MLPSHSTRVMRGAGVEPAMRFRTDFTDRLPARAATHAKMNDGAGVRPVALVRALRLSNTKRAGSP